MKVEVSLEKEDLFSKASLLAAIERDSDVRKLAQFKFFCKHNAIINKL